MNRLVFFVLLSLLPGLAAAQVIVNGVDINTQPITYCQLIGYNRNVLATGRIWIDYGQPGNEQPNAFRKQYFRDRTENKDVTFNSVVDALNFMTSHGWELVTLQVAIDRDVDLLCVYLLRKKAVPTPEPR